MFIRIIHMRWWTLHSIQVYCVRLAQMALCWRPVPQVISIRVCWVVWEFKTSPWSFLSGPKCQTLSATTSWVPAGCFWVTHSVPRKEERSNIQLIFRIFHSNTPLQSPAETQVHHSDNILVQKGSASVLSCKLLHPGGCVDPTNTDQQQRMKQPPLRQWRCL